MCDRNWRCWHLGSVGKLLGAESPGNTAWFWTVLTHGSVCAVGVTVPGSGIHVVNGRPSQETLQQCADSVAEGKSVARGAGALPVSAREDKI